MKSVLLILCLLLLFEVEANETVCFFHHESSKRSINTYENVNNSLYLSFRLDEDLNKYDGVRMKFFGSKRKNSKSEKLYKTHDLSTNFLIRRKNHENMYKLIVLESVGDNIWFSEIGLEKIRFSDFKEIRLEIHLLKQKGSNHLVEKNSRSNKIPFYEHHTNSSSWLDVKQVKRKTKPKVKKPVLPIVALSAIGGGCLLALFSQ